MKLQRSNHSMRLTSVLGAVACALVASCGSEDTPGTGSGGRQGAGASGGDGATGGSSGAGVGGSSGAGIGGSSGFGGSSGASGGSAGASGAAGSGAGMSGNGGMGGDGGRAGSGGSAGSAGEGGSAGVTGVGGSGAGGTSSGTLCLKPGNGDYTKRGPYQVRREKVDLGTGIAPNQMQTTFTIFAPTELEANCKHPFIAWGNGTTVTGPDVYAFLNENAASWGMVVIASDDSNVGSGNYHRKGLDYLVAQNGQSGSKWYQKLSDRAGVSGHSQGGMGATSAQNHPSVKAYVPIGMFARPQGAMPFFCFTGTADIASVPSGCKTAAQNATGPALTGVWEGGDHVTTQTVAGVISGDKGTVQLIRLYTAWFRCFLADDSAACGLFRGGPDNCGICNDPGWNALVFKNL